MCFSFETSISTWIIALLISFYLYHRNRNYDRWNAFFIVTFTTIQLLEAGIWANFNLDLITRFILIFLLLQPFIQSLMGYFHSCSRLLMFLTFIYMIILIYTIYRVFISPKDSFTTIKGQNGHLVWIDTNNKYFLGSKLISFLYILGLFIPLLYMKPFVKTGLPLIFIGVITLIWSLINSTRGEYSSLWCFTAILYAIMAILI